MNRTWRGLTAVAALGVAVTACDAQSSSTAQPRWGTEWTPAERISSTDPIVGPAPLALEVPFAPTPVDTTDGTSHLTYEVVVTNATTVPLTVRQVTIAAADAPGTPLATYGADAVAPNMNLAGDHTTPVARLLPAQTGIFYVDLALAGGTRAPGAVATSMSVVADAPPPAPPSEGGTLTGMVDESGPPAVPTPDTTVTVPVFDGKVPVIGPPLAGDGWAAMEGCCGSDTHHRRGAWSVNGKLLLFKRYAIDFLGVDRDGFAYRGENNKENYVGYGQDVLAVADGTITSAVDGKAENVVGAPQPERDFTEAMGNNLVLDLGDGLYAAYAHLQPGSLRVKAGDRVTRGQVLGKLGNTGQSTAPHLHFQVMDNTNPALAQGAPFEFDSFALAGHATLEDVTYLPTPEPRTDQMPLSQTVLDFPTH
ncbi:M23 family metallopeptidase [Rhodococcus sp. NPDC127528]|uniref:M23 family metallopeptidase n=1 Tax=unclassified Rhodococcus (in: high G+C Gram-positive bacteria) TaxID=192944 RepID=UPI00362F3607